MSDFRFVARANLPQARVTHAVVSDSDKRLCEALRAYGIMLLHPVYNPVLPAAVATHADMVFHHIGGRYAVVESTQLALKKRLLELGFSVEDGYSAGSVYPQEIGLNACAVGEMLLCLPKATYPPIRLGKRILPVRQGYAKCSAAVVSEKALMTEDESIASAARKNGLDVLLLQKGFVRLPGYDYGFIGGCCGKIDRDRLAFCGNVAEHPDYEQMCEFTARYGVQCLSLTDGGLTDVGSILPVCETAECP